MDASLTRALLTLLEGLGRRSAGETWPELEARVARACEALAAALRASGVDRFGVDRAALCAVRRVHAARVTADAGAAARLLFALTSLPEVRAVAGLGGVSAQVTGPSSSAQAAAAVSDATDAYEELSREGLPSSGAGRSLLTPLNPDAGVHALPDDLRTIAVALEAGQRSFDAFAYYGLRYGERGRAFTRTDSAWLAALAEQGLEVTRQVNWLARVLSSRGMPSLLLELHLGELHAALTQACPARVGAYESLRAAAAQLRQVRLAALPDAERLRAEVSLALSALPQAERVVAISTEEAATLVVAALADDAARGGEVLAVGSAASLRYWLADEARFPAAWCFGITRALGF